MQQSSSGTNRFRAFAVNLLYIAGAVGLALLIQTFIIRPFIVSGISMDPTIRDKEYLIIDEVTYHFREPARGEVIVFRAPPEPTKFYIKRVIGLPGDTVKSENGKVSVNGIALAEPYITHHSNDSFTVTVPDGTYFVMGDNRYGSSDSRIWGTLPQKNIRGRALVRLLPVTAIDYLPGFASYTE